MLDYEYTVYLDRALMNKLVNWYQSCIDALEMWLMYSHAC